jgi:integrase/recombinase XerD
LIDLDPQANAIYALVGAMIGMNVEDYFQKSKRGWFRLHEKGGQAPRVPIHHNAEAYMDAYLAAAGIAEQGKSSSFAAWIAGGG